MYLGLDLRGGVHFLLQVDMTGALTKKLDSDATDARACCATRTSATAA
jgi:preprotein translocase subunit SecD